MLIITILSIISGIIVALYSIKVVSGKICHSDKYYQLEAEIAMLQQILHRYKLQGAIIDRIYNECNNEKTQLTLLRQLNSLDKQTFDIEQKIEHLTEQLNQIW